MIEFHLAFTIIRDSCLGKFKIAFKLYISKFSHNDKWVKRNLQFADAAVSQPCRHIPSNTTPDRIKELIATLCFTV